MKFENISQSHIIITDRDGVSVAEIYPQMTSFDLSKEQCEACSETIGYFLSAKYIVERPSPKEQPEVAPVVTADTVTADPVTADTVTADTVTADPVTADTVTADPVTAEDKAPVAPVVTADPVTADTVTEVTAEDKAPVAPEGLLSKISNFISK